MIRDGVGGTKKLTKSWKRTKEEMETYLKVHVPRNEALIISSAASAC